VFLIQILGEKNQLLQQTRDLLLPRLISGKLSLEHLVEKESENLLMAAEPEVVYRAKE
jgi:type I restriction enzyme S subunit